MISGKIGKRIKLYRKDRGYTQEKLAEEIGISTNYLSAVERGVNSLSTEKLVELINVLNCSADEILVDVINYGIHVRATALQAKISKLPVEEQNRILSVVELLADTYEKKSE